MTQMEVTRLKSKTTAFFYEKLNCGKIFDAYDAVHPASQDNSLFVATSVRETIGQKRGVSLDPKLSCSRDQDCPLLLETGEESRTNGVCDLSAKLCQIIGFFLFPTF